MLRLLEALQRETLLLRERAHHPEREVTKLDGAEAYTHKPVHLEPNGLAQPPDFTIPSFGNRDAQLPAPTSVLLQRPLLRPHHSVLELHTFTHGLDSYLRRTQHGDDICSLDFATRMRETMRRCSI